MVGRDIGRRVDWRQLMLRGRYFVMLGLGEDAKFPQRFVQIRHISGDARLDRAEIVVVHFLSLRRHRAEQGSAAEFQILALFIHLAVDQKVFLLRTDRGSDIFDLSVAEELENSQCLFIQGLHGTQQRCFFVKRLSAVGAERGWDAKRLILNKGRRSRVPCGVTACLKGSSEASGWEG